MTRLTLSAAIALLFSNSAIAQPMWEQSDRWRCTLELHIKAQIGQNTARFNEKSGETILDFSKGTSSSAFVSDVAIIGEKHYFESRYGKFNLIVEQWNGQDYPVMIVESKGEFWQTVASGWADADREVWISNYRCVPD